MRNAVRIFVLAWCWSPTAASLAAEAPGAVPWFHVASADMVRIRGGMGGGGQGGMVTGSTGGMGSANGGMEGNIGMGFPHLDASARPVPESPCETSLLTDLLRPTQHARCLAALHPTGAADRGKTKSVARTKGHRASAGIPKRAAAEPVASLTGGN